MPVCSQVVREGNYHWDCRTRRNNLGIISTETHCPRDTLESFSCADTSIWALETKLSPGLTVPEFWDEPASSTAAAQYSLQQRLSWHLGESKSWPRIYCTSLLSQLTAIFSWRFFSALDELSPNFTSWGGKHPILWISSTSLCWILLVLSQAFCSKLRKSEKNASFTTTFLPLKSKGTLTKQNQRSSKSTDFSPSEEKNKDDDSDMGL